MELLERLHVVDWVVALTELWRCLVSQGKAAAMAGLAGGPAGAALW